MPTTDVFCTVVTPIANKQAAIDLGGGFSFSFVAFASPVQANEDGEWPVAPNVIYVWASGPINPAFKAAYEAAMVAHPELYYVDSTPPGAHALTSHPLGPLYRYFPPEV